MALTDSSRIFTTQTTDIDGILDYCKQYFERQGYVVTTEEMASGGFISITKGGIFKTISGMKTGLNITISQMPGAISASMKVGIFGKQLIPTAISMLVFWPVLIPQIYGLIQQNKLDTEAYSVIEAAIRESERSAVSVTEDMVFCMFCGAAMPSNVTFCTSCGKKIAEDNIVCPSCGYEAAGSFAFCPKCGTSLAKND